MSILVLNIEFVIWPDGFILDRTHELSSRIWLVYEQWNWVDYIIACTCAEPWNCPFTQFKSGDVQCSCMQQQQCALWSPLYVYQVTCPFEDDGPWRFQAGFNFWFWPIHWCNSCSSCGWLCAIHILELSHVTPCIRWLRPQYERRSKPGCPAEKTR